MISDRQDMTEQLYKRVCPQEAPPGPRPDPTPRSELNESDADLIDHIIRSRNGEAFRRLWHGDTSDYGDDASRADAALVRRLLWWTGGNDSWVDSLFRQSGLMRPKWDERRRDSTYGRLTIEKVKARMTEFRQAGTRVHRFRVGATPTGTGEPTRCPGTRLRFVVEGEVVREWTL